MWTYLSRKSQSLKVAKSQRGYNRAPTDSGRAARRPFFSLSLAVPLNYEEITSSSIRVGSIRRYRSAHDRACGSAHRKASLCPRGSARAVRMLRSEQHRRRTRPLDDAGSAPFPGAGAWLVVRVGDATRDFAAREARKGQERSSRPDHNGRSRPDPNDRKARSDFSLRLCDFETLRLRQYTIRIGRPVTSTCASPSSRARPAAMRSAVHSAAKASRRSSSCAPRGVGGSSPK